MDFVENLNVFYEYVIFISLLVLHILYCYDLFHNLFSPGLNFGSVDFIVPACVYEGCPEGIQPFLISRELVMWP